MKNKKIIILVIAIIIALIGIAFCTDQLKKKYINMEDKKVLISKSYSNYAWGFQYNGTAIFEDGTIYSWNFNGNKNEFGDYNVNSPEGITDYVLENGKLKTKKVSENDLRKIKDYIEDLEDSIDISYVGADQGSTSISVWDYDSGEKFTLRTGGDAMGENETKNAQELLKIIDKYL